MGHSISEQLHAHLTGTAHSFYCLTSLRVYQHDQETGHTENWGGASGGEGRRPRPERTFWSKTFASDSAGTAFLPQDDGHVSTELIKISVFG